MPGEISGPTRRTTAASCGSGRSTRTCALMTSECPSTRCSCTQISSCALMRDVTRLITDAQQRFADRLDRRSARDPRREDRCCCSLRPARAQRQLPRHRRPRARIVCAYGVSSTFSVRSSLSLNAYTLSACADSIAASRTTMMHRAMLHTSYLHKSAVALQSHCTTHAAAHECEHCVTSGS